MVKAWLKHGKSMKKEVRYNAMAIGCIHLVHNLKILLFGLFAHVSALSGLF
jgi:hypothetical protein